MALKLKTVKIIEDLFGILLFFKVYMLPSVFALLMNGVEQTVKNICKVSVLIGGQINNPIKSKVVNS